MNICQSKNALNLVDRLMHDNSITFKNIQERVSEAGAIPIEEILSKSKEGYATFWRHVLILLYREKFRLSLEKIGEIIGRDHTAVMYGLRKTNKIYEKYKQETNNSDLDFSENSGVLVISGQKKDYIIVRDLHRIKKNDILTEINEYKDKINTLEKRIQESKPQTKDGVLPCKDCDCISMKFVKRTSITGITNISVATDVYECEICDRKIEIDV